MNSSSALIVFEDKSIRPVLHDDEWRFCIVDVVAILSESKNPAWYLKDIRRRDAELSEGWGQIATPLHINTLWWRQKVNCANTEWIFRIIQSISSSKAEPFKRRLAKVGYECVQEIDNPELAAQRARIYYQALGYDGDCIDKRLQSIAIRGQLTDEWKEYAILTAKISKATFGVKPTDYKKQKGLQRENLRENMSNLELIFTMLGEEGARQGAIVDDAQWLKKIRM